MSKRSRSVSPPPQDTIDKARWLRKYVCIDIEANEEEKRQQQLLECECHTPPCRGVKCASTTDFEAHYNAFHRHVCNECTRIFPSNRFLDLHLAEIHNPLRIARTERGERVLLDCYDESCSKRFETSNQRRMHMVDKHKYPRTFFFGITVYGIEVTRNGTMWLDRNMNRDRYKHRDTEKSRKKDKENNDKLTSEESKLSRLKSSEGITTMECDPVPNVNFHLVPSSIRFGRRSGKTA